VEKEFEQFSLYDTSITYKSDNELSPISSDQIPIGITLEPITEDDIEDEEEEFVVLEDSTTKKRYIKLLNENTHTDNPYNKIGKLIVIAGPMYSGKTTELLNYIDVYRRGDKNIIIFKPKIDNRYSVGQISSHTGLKENAIEVDLYVSFYEQIKDISLDAIFIDEFQFFKRDDLVEQFKKIMFELGVDVIVSGLNLNYRLEPFGYMPHVMALADDLIIKKAVCDITKEYNGVYTLKKDDDGKIVDVGGNEKYIAVSKFAYAQLMKRG